MTTSKKVRTTQPQGNVGIDWSNPITKGLISCIIPTALSGKLDILNQDLIFTNNGNTLISPTSLGNAAINSIGGTSGIYTGRGQYGRLAIQLPLTIVSHGRISAASYGDKKNFFGINTGVYGGFSLGSDYGKRRARIYGVFSHVGTVPWVSPLQAMVATGQEVYVFDGENKVATAAGSGTISYDILYGHINIFGGNEATSAGCGGEFYYGAVWTRALTDIEIKSISDNPWQIFAPIKTPIFVGSGATVTRPMFVSPAGDISKGDWTSATATLAESLRDNDDETFINVESASTYTGVLDPAAFPGGANQTISFKGASTQASSVTIVLTQNGTTLLNWTQVLTADLTQYTTALTSAVLSSDQITFTITSS